MSSDPYKLDRFVQAQSSIYPRVLEELRSAHKRSHWMWFIFPQIAGLGSSPMAQAYAISGADEARAYLAHPILGPRLRECTALVNAAPEGRTVDQIFGYPDNLKFCSSITLFASVAPEEAVFQTALDRFFNGQPDNLTLRQLRGQ